MPSPKPHDFDPLTDRCRRCGIWSYKVGNPNYGCSKTSAAKAMRRPKKPRKPTWG